MQNFIPKVILFAMTLLPILVIGGAAWIHSGPPIVGSDISEVEFLNDSENRLELIFFGYAGCSFICPNSVTKMATVLEQMDGEDPEINIGGIFIDVNAETQVRRAHEYGAFFSKKIRGFNVNKDQLNVLRQKFGINVIETGKLPNEIIHTDHFFVLSKQESVWKIQAVLPNKSSDKNIKEAILIESFVLK